MVDVLLIHILHCMFISRVIKLCTIKPLHHWSLQQGGVHKSASQRIQELLEGDDNLILWACAISATSSYTARLYYNTLYTRRHDLECARSTSRNSDDELRIDTITQPDTPSGNFPELRLPERLGKVSKIFRKQPSGNFWLG